MDLEDTVAGVVGSDDWILRFGIHADSAGELARLAPLSQNELVLVFDVGVDAVSKKTTLNSVIRHLWIVRRPVWHATTDQAVCVVASAWCSLALDGLASRIGPSNMRPDGTA